MTNEHEHDYNWTGWYEAGTGVTHMLEANDYKCWCGSIKGRQTRNGRKLTDEERGN